MDTFADDEFIKSFTSRDDLPVWMIADPAILAVRGFPDCVAIVNSDPVGRCFPLFTAADLAKRFIEEANLSNKRPCCLHGESTRILLAHFHKSGVEHVGIDVSFNPPKRGRFVPIQQVLDAIPPDHGIDL